jgi:hypothetical protein
VLIAFCFLLASCGGSGDQAKKEKKEEKKEENEKADKERANKERADREKAEQKRAAQNPPQQKLPSKSPRRSKSLPNSKLPPSSNPRLRKPRRRERVPGPLNQRLRTITSSTRPRRTRVQATRVFIPDPEIWYCRWWRTHRSRVVEEELNFTLKEGPKLLRAPAPLYILLKPSGFRER